MSVLKSMILLLILWAVIVIVLTSCSTSSPKNPEGINYDAACTTNIELRNNTKFEIPEDVDNLVNAEEGCIRHYGAGSCLVRFIKTGKLSYYAICKRATNN